MRYRRDRRYRLYWRDRLAVKFHGDTLLAGSLLSGMILSGRWLLADAVRRSTCRVLGDAPPRDGAFLTDAPEATVRERL
jgi:hypothetical protein